MILRPFVLKAVKRAFEIAADFTPQVTFQMQIVWNINPVNDSEQRVPTVVRSVPAVQWKNIYTRNEQGFLTFDEMLCVRQWDDIPGPTDNDLVIDPNGITRQIEKVEPDPAGAVWLITLRGPTA